jgi:hypothetical protein
MTLSERIKEWTIRFIIWVREVDREAAEREWDELQKKKEKK